MAENKTTATDASVEDFIASVDDETMRRDSGELLALMGEVTGEAPRMWGPSIVGFGSYHYRYESGREGDFFLTGFSPRKSALSVYVMGGFEPHADRLARLGKHKLGKSCLYLKSLDAIDRDVLREIITASVADMRARYPDA